MASVIGGIIGLVLTVIMVTSVLVPTLLNTNTDSWDAQTTAIFNISLIVSVAGLVCVIGIIAIIYLIMTQEPTSCGSTISSIVGNATQI